MKAVPVKALTHSFVHLDAVAASVADKVPEATPAVGDCCSRMLYDPDGYYVHEEFGSVLLGLADAADKSVAAATAYTAPLVPAQATVDTVGSWILVGVLVSYAAIFHNLTKYSKGPSRAAYIVSEQEHTLHIDSVEEEDNCLVEVRSYCSSFRLHRDCLLVRMGLTGTLRTAAEPGLFDLPDCADYKYLKGDPRAFYHSSERQ